MPHVLLIGCVGYVVTDMRLKKLLRRLLATPMRKSHFLMSLIGGRAIRRRGAGGR